MALESLCFVPAIPFLGRPRHARHPILARSNGFVPQQRLFKRMVGVGAAHTPAELEEQFAVAMAIDSDKVPATPPEEDREEDSNVPTSPPEDEDESTAEERRQLENMRNRLEGLFGLDEDQDSGIDRANFDGEMLRQVLVDRWGVQYDVQPQVRQGRVYLQIMWRYFEQQSFYMNEDEYASHCEAVALLLKKWEKVDYFLDYITTIRKRPVVGIAVNIPMPDIKGNSNTFQIE